MGNEHILAALTNLELHETMDIDESTTVMKVPNGLLYTSKGYVSGDTSLTVSSTFVPFRSYRDSKDSLVF